jgi:hypothetical protein
MALRWKNFVPNTPLKAAEQNDLANNGCVQIDTAADLDDPNLAAVNVTFTQDTLTLYRRTAPGVGADKWAEASASGGLLGSPPSSIANSGGSASLTGNTVTFTDVSSISLNKCFTGDYDNYRIIISGSGSSDPGLYIRLRAAGSDATGSDYNHQFINGISTTVAGARLNANYWYPIPFYTSDDNCISLDIFRPFLASRTIASFIGQYGLGSASLYVGSLNHTLTTSYDGLTVYPSTGALTGVLSVYGYKN